MSLVLLQRTGRGSEIKRLLPRFAHPLHCTLSRTVQNGSISRTVITTLTINNYWRKVHKSFGPSFYRLAGALSARDLLTILKKGARRRHPTACKPERRSAGDFWLPISEPVAASTSEWRTPRQRSLELGNCRKMRATRCSIIESTCGTTVSQKPPRSWSIESHGSSQVLQRLADFRQQADRHQPKDHIRHSSSSGGDSESL